MKINSKTTLASIKNAVRSDFGIKIDNENAKDIRGAARNGTLVWTPSHLRITQTSWNFQVTSSGVKDNGSAYNKAEWNAAH